MPWTDYTDDLEWHFTPSRVSPEARLPAMAVRDAASAEALRTLAAERDVVYGPGPRQKLDLFPAQGRAGKQDTALFAAYGPVGDPQWTVAVVVEEAGFGGSVAAPVARSIFEAALGRQDSGAAIVSSGID